MKDGGDRDHSPWRAAGPALSLALLAVLLLAGRPAAARAEEPAPARVLPETISAGMYHTCGLKADGSVACWGLNDSGQATPPAHDPGDYLQVSAGRWHTCGLRADGSVACWGDNGYGQAPPSVGAAGDYLQVSAGLRHSCGLKADGSVACWGVNDDG